MKGARERRHDRSRRGILEAARELVLESGVENLSLRKVAERADYSPASLYEYFDGKDHLVRELAAEVMRRLDARLAQVPTTLAPPKRLVRLGLSYVAFSRENPEDFLLLFTRLRSRRRSPAEPPGQASPYARIVGAVREGVEGGWFARREDRDVETIAYGLWAIAHGMAMLQLTHLHGYDADFEAADALALEAFIAGLG
jgi:AcrR family transcriptional regulator